MRQNPNSRRSRGRGNRKPGGNSRNQVFDSNGPGARVRGNSAQIYEKYQQLARDAASSGDRVAAEGFYQHAEHYYRLMEAAGLNRENNSQDQAQQPQQRNGNVAPNGAAAESAEASVEQPSAPAAPAAEVDAETATTPAELAELVQSKEAGQSDQAPADTSSGSGDADEGKPARRTRSRRANGSANRQSKSAKAAEAESNDDGSETPAEDSEPVSA
ncbi:MAG: DUF4167 domain-containing protein [Alphaproteobacteria bacterium]|nr:DUF4167 domain-containing protein [Alphaproteobacteria bacterium]